MFILFILSLILMVLAFWGIERKFNFFYEVKSWFDNISNRLQQQTKLKIDIFKIIIVIITGGVIAYLCFFLVKKLYLPYFEQILDVSRGGSFVLKSLDEENPDLISNWFVFSSLINDSLNFTENDNSSRIGDWGTFGDFIGGTLNPIIGFISILLLFATWKLTRRTLEFTKEELKNNNQLLVLQQFDSWFFNLLEGFQVVNKEYSEYVIKEDFYKNLFLDKESNLAISKNILLIQYFSSLSILLKIINSKLEFVKNKEERDELKSFYVDIVLSQISGDIQQVIAWFAFQDDDLKITLENSGFFKKIDFKYYVDRNGKVFADYNFELLSQLHRYDEKIFQGSKKYLDLKNIYLYEIFFGEEPFIYKFFQKQYSSEIFLKIEEQLTKATYEIKLVFDEKGINYGAWDNVRNGYGLQMVKYQNMIFNNSNILVPLKNMKIVIPFGNLSKINITDTDVYVLNALKIN